MDISCGCGAKFDSVIVSARFEGKSLIQRHRLVNDTIAAELKAIHAFSMRTLTPDQWATEQSKIVAKTDTINATQTKICSK